MAEDDLKRVRYFNGLIMQEEDFILEQDYHIKLQRLHNRHLHGAGIVFGLEVELIDAENVRVTPGMALDESTDGPDDVSREIYLTGEEEVNLGLHPAGTEYYIWISYTEAPDPMDVYPAKGGSEPIYIAQTGQVNFGESLPEGANSTEIILARVVYTASGDLDGTSITYLDDEDKSLRLLSSFKADSAEFERLTLRHDNDADPTYARLDGFFFSDTGDNGINAVSDRTRFFGRVDVDEELHVTQDGNFDIDINVTADANIGGDVIVTGEMRSTNASGKLEINDAVHVAESLDLSTGATVNEFSTDGTMADDSDTAVPTEQAVKTYVDAKIQEFIDDQLVGCVAAFAVDSPPDGWLECNGDDVDRTTYANLFARIQTTFGAGNGTTTFNIPDLRGEFIRGWDHGEGNDPDAASRTDSGDGTTGDNLGTKQADAFQDHGHDHQYALYADTGGSGIFASGSTGPDVGVTGGIIHTPEAYGANPAPRFTSETRPRNVALMYCIKY